MRTAHINMAKPNARSYQKDFISMLRFLCHWISKMEHMWFWMEQISIIFVKLNSFFVWFVSCSLYVFVSVNFREFDWRLFLTWSSMAIGYAIRIHIDKMFKQWKKKKLHSPSNFMPTSKHFWNRQYGHRFRWVLSMWHCRSATHVYTFLFCTVRLKNPLHDSHVNKP